MKYNRKTRKIRGGANINSKKQASEMNNLQREYMASLGIEGDNGYNTHSQKYQNYKQRYNRDPVNDARKYANSVYKTIHSSKNKNLDEKMIELKSNIFRKTLEPNPLKRLFKRNRRSRRRN